MQYVRNCTPCSTCYGWRCRAVFEVLKDGCIRMQVQTQQVQANKCALMVVIRSSEVPRW